MNDISSSAYNAQNADDNRLKSDSYDEFLDALDLLYIKSNLSGRLKFFENWPHVARHIFGDELIGYDHDGTADMERRRVLEEEAEERRLALLELVQTVEEKSVEKSVLQVEYVEALVKKLGRDTALLVYAPKIVDRYLPADPADVVVGDDEDAKEDVVAVKKPRPSDVPDEFAEVPSVKPIVPDIDDNLDAVQPISVAPPSPVAPPVEAPVVQEHAPQEPLMQPSAPVDDVPPPAPVESAPPQGLPPSDPTVQDVSQQSKHKAFGDDAPIASQKMTFVPSKPATPDAPAKSSVVPVVGQKADDPQD